jgi:hypothetical protein
MQSVHFLLGGLRLTIFSITLVHKHSRLRLPLDPGQELHCTQDFQRPSRLLRSRCEVRIGQGQVRKKLRWMMKRTQMKKPDFFCDIEFVTVAMVFVFFAFLMTSLMLLYMQYSFVFYILKKFVHIIPVRVFKEREKKY